MRQVSRKSSYIRSFGLTYSIVLAFFLGFNLSCSKQLSEPEELITVSDSSARKHQPMLWEATKGKQRVFILGTFHIGIKPSELDQVVWKSLEEAQTVILEMDIGSVKPEDAIPYMFLPPGQSLRSILGSDAWQKLVARFGPQFPEDKLDRLSLTAVFQMLVSSLAPHSESIDRSILLSALDQGKKTAFLESFRFQAQLLEQYIEAEMVRDLLNKGQEAQEFFQKMMAVYMAGDLNELDQLMQDQDSDFAMTAEQFEMMVTARNLRWAEVLEQYFGQSNAFVAVGAGHLPGKQGLLQLLKDRGYQIRRVETR